MKKSTPPSAAKAGKAPAKAPAKSARPMPPWLNKGKDKKAMSAMKSGGKVGC